VLHLIRVIHIRYVRKSIDIEQHLNATNSALQKGDVKGALLSLNQTQMLLKNQEANEHVNACGIQCKVEVNESVIQARNELENGNTSGALLHLDAAQMALNTTEEDGNNLSQQILRNIH
jgi:polysaccharide pyruvyl transferase WcaK-like protein